MKNLEFQAQLGIKEQGNKGIATSVKGCKTREAPCTCRYTSGYLISSILSGIGRPPSFLVMCDNDF